MVGDEQKHLREFIDALRLCIGLAPLYRQLPDEPPLLETEFGTLDTPAALVQARTPLHFEPSRRDSLAYHRSSDGRKVGRVFLQKPVVRKRASYAR